MDHDGWLAALDRQGTAFGAAAERAGMDAPVPSCPPWSVRDLVTHLGSVYRWVTGHVARGVDDPFPFRTFEPDGDPLAWFQDGLAGLRDVLGGLDPAAPAWNPSRTAPNVVAFWPRRMAHETAVHRWDAELAGGGQPAGFGTELAADGVGEVLESMLVRRSHLEPLASARAVVRVGCTDTGDRWLVTLRPGEVDTLRLAGGGAVDGADPAAGEGAAAGEPDATVTGPAEQIYLVAWGRHGLDTVTVTGDAGLAALVCTG